MKEIFEFVKGKKFSVQTFGEERNEIELKNRNNGKQIELCSPYLGTYSIGAKLENETFIEEKFYIAVQTGSYNFSESGDCFNWKKLDVLPVLAGVPLAEVKAKVNMSDDCKYTIAISRDNWNNSFSLPQPSLIFKSGIDLKDYFNKELKLSYNKTLSIWTLEDKKYFQPIVTYEKQEIAYLASISLSFKCRRFSKCYLPSLQLL